MKLIVLFSTLFFAWTSIADHAALNCDPRLAYVTSKNGRANLRALMDINLTDLGIRPTKRKSILQLGFSRKMEAKFGEPLLQRLAAGEKLAAWEIRQLNGTTELISSLPAVFLKTGTLDWAPQLIFESTSINVLRPFIFWSPLWVGTAQEKEIVAALKMQILEVNNKHLEEAALLLSWLVEAHLIDEEFAKEFVLERSRGFPNQRDLPGILKLASILPYAKWPTEFRSDLAPWLSFDVVPPLTSDRVGMAYGDASYSGVCELMTKHHLCSIVFEKRENVKAWLVKLDGELMGAIKGVTKEDGDRSMLSFRNVFDRSGRLILMAGGVYRVQQRNLQAPKDGQVLRLDDLKIRPIALLFNLEDFELLKAWREYLSDLYEPFKGQSSGIPWLSSTQRSVSDKQFQFIWKTTIQQIDAARKRLEQ